MVFERNQVVVDRFGVRVLKSDIVIVIWGCNFENSLLTKFKFVAYYCLKLIRLSRVNNTQSPLLINKRDLLNQKNK